ncbi:MAG: iron-containing alcohol dehydrogenase [Planctomycetota bacterium]
MQNFTYTNPTRIVFGRGSIAELRNLVPPGKVLLTYGGGSIFANGVHRQVREALSARTDVEVVEFGGIRPNPAYEHLMDAVRVARGGKIDFLLAVGGGSVVDGTKFIGAAARYEGGDPWEILSRHAEVSSAVPLGAVLTLPATGSESNGFAVISRDSTREKLPFRSEHCYPRFAILDPEATFSLPKKQIRNGIVDAFAHVMEQYCTYPAAGALQDRQAEAILATLVEIGPKTLERPQDYDLRANFVWCATQALNGLIGCGVPQDWATHMIGHELTAFYGVDHGESLAIVLPSLLWHQRARKAEKLRQYGERVWGIRGDDDPAERAIAKTREFFESLGVPTRLSAYGISPAEAAAKVGGRFRARGSRIGEDECLGPEDVEKILAAC